VGIEASPAKKRIKSFKDKDKRTRKFVCYILCSLTKASNRRIGRWLGVSKDTVLNWYYEVQDWPKAEQVAVAKEVNFKHLPKGLI